MSESLVVDSSSPICLARAGYLHLLTDASAEILIPDEVAHEILVGPVTDPARVALERGWGTRVSAPAVSADLLEWSLGAGETAVLAVTRQVATRVAVLDDAEARKCARALGIGFIGTLALVVQAKLAGRIPAAAEVVKALRTAGLHLDDALIREVLSRTVGEGWPM